MPREEAARFSRDAAVRGETVVFTNGCFDLLHRGHVDLLAAARALGDRLVVGVNDDDSVRRQKGANRPWMSLEDRAAVLAALAAVDVVVAFSEDTPRELIEELRPRILVKGGDYRVNEVVGREQVEADGGRVVIVPLTEGRSSSAIRARVSATSGGPRSGNPPGATEETVG